MSNSDSASWYEIDSESDLGKVLWDCEGRVCTWIRFNYNGRCINGLVNTLILLSAL